MTLVGTQPTGIWLDHIGAIYGRSDNAAKQARPDEPAGTAGRTRCKGQRPYAGSSSPSSSTTCPTGTARRSRPTASSGANNGLPYYENALHRPDRADPDRLREHANLRVVTIIEPDSLPNLVTNLEHANCAPANSAGLRERRRVRAEQAARDPERLQLRRHRALGLARLVQQHDPGGLADHTMVAPATTAGVNSVDGFISDTANTTPITEPYMTADRERRRQAGGLGQLLPVQPVHRRADLRQGDVLQVGQRRASRPPSGC